MRTVLLSGFEPFQGANINPSWELARQLHGHTVAGHRIESVQLPCEFSHQAGALRQAIAQHRPRLVLAMGLAAGRAELSFERVAINLIDAPIPDNAGDMPIDQPVLGDGPPACFSTLPLRAMVAAARAAGVPAALSTTAGTYVCNQVFYLLQQALAGQSVPSGFLHLPLMPEQACALPVKPSMALDCQRRGVLAALACALGLNDGAQAPGINTGPEGCTH